MSQNQTALIIGAHSDMARAIANQLASEGYNLQLAARNAQARLARSATDLILRHQGEVNCLELDVAATDSHADFIEQLTPLPDVVVCVAGVMPDQQSAEQDYALAKLMIDTNYAGVVSLFEGLAPRMASRGTGCLVGISSVAGDRGRQKNYIYGSTKAALTTYLSGLRNRLASKGVHVITVKPGFVNTAMTEGMDLPEKLTAEASEVALDISKAIQKQRNIIYSKPIWRLVMLVIKHIPEFIFKKLDI
jgi:short-subunit dehydrogenase